MLPTHLLAVPPPAPLRPQVVPPHLSRALTPRVPHRRHPQNPVLAKVSLQQAITKAPLSKVSRLKKLNLTNFSEQAKTLR